MIREKRRIAFFGGTFDPLHNGHLEMARAAAEWLLLHRICFVPTRRNPLKEEGPFASSEDRLEMIRLGIANEPTFGIWEGELFREDPSYTLHSVQHIERVYPNCHLFWIIGADHLMDLPRWYGIRELVRKIGFILVDRPGVQTGWPSIPGLTVYPVPNRLNPVSATDVRERARARESLSGLVPSAVEAYIRDKGLYLK
ncbi:MAG: nicotinate (nicotinamide) nucleotide adenylyltransferase [Oceanipulchritudo sp.]|jgi:nicotinate-nucleotide adenylyltransferase